MKVDWIALDWGSSNLRAMAMDRGGRMLAEARSDDGAGKLAASDFEPALLNLIAPWLGAGRTPVIACGMVGSRQGWIEAPYQPTPSDPRQAKGAVRVTANDPRLDLYILPGLCQASPADVMRGEETQIAGFLSNEPSFEGVICLPGTHSKWAEVSDGYVTSFRTFMTGELFALLSRQSVLRHSVSAEGHDTESFSRAVAVAFSRPAAISGELFALRAEALLSGLDPVKARSRLSGLLIGGELAAARSFWLGRATVVIGETALAEAYRCALQTRGVAARLVDAETMTRDGLRAAFARLETSSHEP